MPRALASEVRVETLVAEQLRGAQLSLLESDKLTEGLQKYVQGDAGAIKGECRALALSLAAGLVLGVGGEASGSTA